MKWLKTEHRETVYDIQLTETELGTILVALGNMTYSNLLSCNRSYENPYKISNDADQLNNLTDELAELID